MGRATDADRPLRLFLGLELDERTRSALAAWSAQALAGRDDLRPVATDALHVTLVFLGATPPDEVRAVWDKARAAGTGHRAATLTPAGIAAVPPRRPRLLALELADEGARADLLQRAVSATLVSAGLCKPARRPLWPHVTLARVRRGARAAPLQAAPPAAAPFSTPSMALYRSHLSPRGARYEVLDRLELAL